MQSLDPLPVILMIEMDDATAELYRRVLSKDYQVRVCSDDHEALEVLRTQDIVAVVLEPVGFGNRGWDLLRRITTARGPGAMPVVVCTTSDERRRGMQLGAAAYLVKPVLPTVLLETLHEIRSRAVSGPASVQSEPPSSTRTRWQ